MEKKSVTKDKQAKKTSLKKKSEGQKKDFFLFDAKGKVLGRLATQVARVLSGKNRIDYSPNVGGNAWAIVINSDQVKVTGKKEKEKIYWRHSGYPGGIYKRTFEEMMKKDSTEVIKRAVKGMLPKNKLSREAMKRLRVFKDKAYPYKDKITQRQ